MKVSASSVRTTAILAAAMFAATAVTLPNACQAKLLRGGAGANQASIVVDKTSDNGDEYERALDRRSLIEAATETSTLLSATEKKKGSNSDNESDRKLSEVEVLGWRDRRELQSHFELGEARGQQRQRQLQSPINDKILDQEGHKKARRELVSEATSTARPSGYFPAIPVSEDTARQVCGTDFVNAR